MSILINLLLGMWTLVALLMMLVILMQRPKSEGLGAAFGGGVTENIFGAQTTNVLVKFTAWLAGIFFALTFLLSVLYAHKSMAESSLSRELKKASSSQALPPAQTSPAASGSPAGTAATASPGTNASAAQTGPPSSPAPDSGAGVVPAGKAPPAAAPPTSPSKKPQ